MDYFFIQLIKRLLKILFDKSIDLYHHVGLFNLRFVSRVKFLYIFLREGGGETDFLMKSIIHVFDQVVDMDLAQL